MDVTDFQTEVIEASRERPVVVDFWAPWCGPCRILGPVLEKLASEAGEKWCLAKLNTDENTAVASRYGISSIPAVKLFVDGDVVSEFVGALPEPRVRQWLDAALPSENKARLAEAEAALAAGDDARAEVLARAVLDVDPDEPDARILLARLTVFDAPDAASAHARAAATAKPGLLPAAQAIESVARLLEEASRPEVLPGGPGREAYTGALFALAAKDIDAAIAGFINVIRSDRRYHDDASRRACVAVFGLLGDRHPLTLKHRRALEMALF